MNMYQSNACHRGPENANVYSRMSVVLVVSMAWCHAGALRYVDVVASHRTILHSHRASECQGLQPNEEDQSTPQQLHHVACPVLPVLRKEVEDPRSRLPRKLRRPKGNKGPMEMAILAL